MAGAQQSGQEVGDGVDERLQKAGFKAVVGSGPGESNLTPETPLFTHWSSTAVDRMYFQCNESLARVIGSHVFFSGVSGHLPVVLDVELTPTSK